MVADQDLEALRNTRILLYLSLHVHMCKHLLK